MKKLLPLLVVGTLVLSGLGAVAFTFDYIKKDFLLEQKGLNNISLNDDELDQYQIEFNYQWPVGLCPWWIPPNVNYSIAQSFKPTKNVLTRVQILIGRNRTATYPFVLAIREELTGDDIAIASVDAEDIANESYNWTEFDFADILVTTGQTYYMVSYTADVTDNWYGWAAGIPNPYPNGTMAVSVNDGETWEENDTYDMCFMTYGIDNSPPEIPTIGGLTKGKAGEEYEYTFNATDPDGDNVRYIIDWGDNTSNRTGYYPSGTDVKVKHTWSKKGIYNITAKAQDVNGDESNWSEFAVEIEVSRDRATTYLWYQWFLDKHPILERLLSLFRVI